MSELILTEDYCTSCKYYTQNEGYCDYLFFEGHSRIMKDGKMAYDPQYCDKYEAGARKRGYPKGMNR